LKIAAAEKKKIKNMSKQQKKEFKEAEQTKKKFEAVRLLAIRNKV
jgi:hypothetical protein